MKNDSDEGRRKLKNTVWLVCILAAVSLILMLSGLPGKTGTEAVVTVDGKVKGVYSLDKDRTVTITTDYGKNTLEISHGHADMVSADCRDKICVRHKAVSRQGESIVCLPHRLVVSIEGSSDAPEVDVITR